MKTPRLLASVLLITFASLLLMGFKPAPPPATKRYTDAKKGVEIVISTKGYRIKSVALHDKKRGKTFKWKKLPRLPGHVVIAPKLKRVAWIGGYGAACGDLGLISIYDFAGNLKKRIDLKQKKLPDLKKLSGEFTKICCPCFWIHQAAVDKTGKNLELNVCKKRSVKINLKRLTIRVQKI